VDVQKFDNRYPGQVLFKHCRWVIVLHLDRARRGERPGAAGGALMGIFVLIPLCLCGAEERCACLWTWTGFSIVGSTLLYILNQQPWESHLSVSESACSIGSG
jgi:hypothetical protein